MAGSIAAPAADLPPAARSVWRALVASPYLWGGLTTVAFYAAIPHLPVHREMAQRYFCSHPIEYIQTGLFLVGLFILVFKARHVQVERRTLREIAVAPAPAGSSPPEVARILDERLAQLAPRQRTSYLGQRLHDVAAFVRGRQSATGLEEHLKHLADGAADRMAESYSLLQTINWAGPILGFLGTVMGITLAIANVTPDQLDSSLNEVTGGLAVAFDTTSLALSMSIVLVFTQLFVKGAEERVLARVEELGIHEITALFPIADDAAHASPLALAEAEAARQLIERTESLIRMQTGLWQESVDALRQRWSQTLGEHQQQLHESLHAGMGDTLTDHTRQLAEVRHEFVAGYREVSRELASALEASQIQRHEQNAALHHGMDSLWQRMQADVHEVQVAQTQQIERLAEELTRHMTGWQEQLAQATAAAESQMGALSRQTALLARVVEQEEHLAGLQQRLTENLAAVRAAETFEETLHNLSAAVHLLTTKVKTRAA